MPHRGIEPASATCRSDALPTELHTHALVHVVHFNGISSWRQLLENWKLRKKSFIPYREQCSWYAGTSTCTMTTGGGIYSVAFCACLGGGNSTNSTALVSVKHGEKKKKEKKKGWNSDSRSPGLNSTVYQYIKTHQQYIKTHQLPCHHIYRVCPRVCCDRCNIFTPTRQHEFTDTTTRVHRHNTSSPTRQHEFTSKI